MPRKIWRGSSAWTRSKNYDAAIEQFSAAIASNPAAPDPLIGRARCFYKAIVDSKIDPQEFHRTADEAMQAAIQDLQQAQQLNPNLVEPNLWLGKADQQLKKIADADIAFANAVKLAEAQKLPEQALYLFQWAHNAELNPTASPAERTNTVRERAKKLGAAPSMGGSSTAKQAAILIGECLLAEGKFADAMKEYDAVLVDYDKADPAKPVDPTKADNSDASLLYARALCRVNQTRDWNLAAAEAALRDLNRVIQLSPGPAFEAAANYWLAKAKSQSLLSTSSSFTADKKNEYRNELVTNIEKAIQLAPNDPGSWEWRRDGAIILQARITANATPESAKALGPEARRWINEAIEMVAKRPDLATEKMAGLQRIQQNLEAVLTKYGLSSK